jgi:hypothetical protein
MLTRFGHHVDDKTDATVDWNITENPSVVFVCYRSLGLKIFSYVAAQLVRRVFDFQWALGRRLKDDFEVVVAGQNAGHTCRFGFKIQKGLVIAHDRCETRREVSQTEDSKNLMQWHCFLYYLRKVVTFTPNKGSF